MGWEGKGELGEKRGMGKEGNGLWAGKDGGKLGRLGMRASRKGKGLAEKERVSWEGERWDGKDWSVGRKEKG